MNSGVIRCGLAVLATLVAPAAASADTANFELNGKIYTKYMYQNDDTQGCLSMSNPFWSDNIGGHNGACTELELNIEGHVSKYITAGARVKSRWGALWQDWWENGDLNPEFQQDTSGESLGMNHAQYMKLRGAWVRLALPIPTVKWIHVGSSDLGMFNAWTIGKSRYIDRDNGQGVFIDGAALPGGMLDYNLSAIALPKLYVGPGWNTGLAANEPLAGLWGTDWAYAGKIASRLLGGDLQLTLIGSYIADWEANKRDPDLTGPTDANRGADHAVDLRTRFRAYNGSFEAAYTPAAFDFLSVHSILAYSWNKPNLKYATNAVEGSQGFSPVLFLLDKDGHSVPAEDFAGTATVELFDPLGVGLTLRAQYFNIGSKFNAIFGARREADVLLTDGLITSGWTSGGQLPTLNIANEFIDFDEPWYESVIGWKGVTGVAEWTHGLLRVDGELTYIGYNTNMQNRDIDLQYPSYLYTDGFTDTYAFTAESDYANIYDRGKDPRSVYKRNQNRHTYLGVAKAELVVPGISRLTLKGKLKYIWDKDLRQKKNPDDNYLGQAYLVWGQAVFQVNNELKASLGYEWTRWIEDKRSGSLEAGYFDYDTTRKTGRVGLSYTFGGATASYVLEYLVKDQQRDDPATFNQHWNIWRSKATLEVGW